MRKKITIFTALTLLTVMMTLVCLTSCGNNGQNENTESDNSDDLSVFNYEESDLSEYFKLASLDNLTLDAVKSYIESERAKAIVSDYGDKITLKDGSTVEADYILYDADMEKALESGSFSYTLGDEEPFSGLYSALSSSVVTIGSERMIRTLAVPERYEEESVVMVITPKKVSEDIVSADDYAQPLEYYRAALLLEYNKSLSESERAIANGDLVLTSYKLVSRAENEGYKVGDVIDSGDSFSFTVGSGKTVAGFDAAFLGHSEGDSFENDMTLPEDYGSEYMHGLDVTFECTVKKVSKPLSDDTAKAMGYNDLDDFNAKTDAHAKRSYIISNAALGVLKRQSELISLPSSAVYNYKDESTYYRYYYLNYLIYYYSVYGSDVDIDTLAKTLYGYDTAQAYLVAYFNSADLQKEAERYVERNLLLFTFVKAAGLDISDSEFSEKHADDTAVILGYNNADEYHTVNKAYYDVDDSRSLALLKLNYYRLVTEDYLTERYPVD